MPRISGKTYTTNPYKCTTVDFGATLVRLDEEYLNLIVRSLLTLSLRILFYCLATLKTDGTVRLETKVLTQMLRQNAGYVRRGKRQLVIQGFLARQSMDVYYFNPRIAVPGQLLIY